MSPGDQFQNQMEDKEGGGGILKEALPMIVAGAAVSLIATSIRLWAGVELIQKDVATLTKSDASQTEEITVIKSDVNDLRVKFGILKAVVDMIRK